MAAAPLWAQSPSTRPPNIVFILADDLGYGDLGCYGQQKIATPNIDRLAREGMRFTQSYAGATVCAPSRCALMTGLHGGHARVRGNTKPEVPLRPEDTTVAQVLKQAGYRTALIGKWGLGDAGTTGLPNLKGFDEFFGYHTQLQAHTSYPHQLWENDREYVIPNNWGAKHHIFSQDLFTERALKFLDSNRSNPFYLYLAYTSPHANNELGRDTGNGIEVPELGDYADKPWPPVERSFAASVSRLDRDVGRVLQRIHDLGLDGNTLVLFSSDNGPHHEGGHDSKYFRSSGPLRGIKRDLYEGGIRTPFIARWTGHITPNSTSDQVIAFWDFLPTAAELVGAKGPAGLDGVSYVPALMGKPLPNRPTLYWEFHEGGFNQAVRFGNWKAIRFGSQGPIELYDLSRDIGEQHNLASSEPDVVNQARELLARSRVDSPLFPAQQKAAPTPDRRNTPAL
jgi:arylsulfatase A-like enzyme